jgi:nitrite reductase/ring-hydroxylating ferredoxin subunit/uncharacterized membrane protein
MGSPMPIAQQLVAAALATPGLDGAADALSAGVRRLLDRAGNARQPLRDALSGTWLGHPVHPAITDVPVGAWTAALVLDLAGQRRAAKIAVGVGLAGALGAALTGLNDWLDTYGRPRRLGVVHATLNGTATLLYATSFLARGSCDAAGIALSTLGYGTVALSALYGGELSLDEQIGVNHAHAAEPPSDEVDVGLLDDVPDGGMRRVDAHGYPIVLVRRGVTVFALAATCAHQGGPLDQGTLDGETITCPWHGSTFCVTDGSIVNGPAAEPQPVLRARVLDGRVRVAGAASALPG